MSSGLRSAGVFLSIISVSNYLNIALAILTPFGEPKERFADPDMGSLSSGSSTSLVNVSEIFVMLRVGVRVFLCLLETNCFCGVVGVLLKDVLDAGS